VSTAASATGRVQADVRDAVRRLIDEGREIGVQVVAYLGGEKIVDVSEGVADEATGRAVAPDTLFHVFSVTKAVLVTALHLQAERGRIGYDDLVTTHWPEYGQHGKGATTVRDVITHRSGVPQMPADVTPEKMCDWDWMVSQIAAMQPLAPPGSRGLYQSMTHGWLVGELVRRTDPAHRDIGRFIREEIAEPIGATDLWVGLPEAAAARVAKLTLTIEPFDNPPELYSAATPPQVDLVPSVFERPEVMRAPIAGVGGIFSAQSCARFWALLAEGGALDGVRLLSADRVATFNRPRANADESDIVMFGQSLPLSEAGFWLGQEQPPCAAARYRRVICHPGAGNSHGFADLEKRLAFAFCHNRMTMPASRAEDSSALVAETLRASLGLEG